MSGITPKQDLVAMLAVFNANLAAKEMDIIDSVYVFAEGNITALKEHYEKVNTLFKKVIEFATNLPEDDD